MYFDYDVNGLSKGIMVDDSMNHDVVTSICPIERLGTLIFSLLLLIRFRRAWLLYWYFWQNALDI